MVHVEKKDGSEALIAIGNVSAGRSSPSARPLCPFYDPAAKTIDPQKDAVIFGGDAADLLKDSQEDTSKRGFFRTIIRIEEMNFMPYEKKCNQKILCMDAGRACTAVVLEDGSVWTTRLNTSDQLGQGLDGDVKGTALFARVVV